MKRFAGSILVLLVIAIGAIWYFVSHGISARTPPNVVEAWIAPRLRNLAIPSSARDAKDPVVSSPDVMDEAMAHFADHCSFCHANDGGGQTHISQGFYPKPPDMRLDQTQSLTDGELYYIIENGVRFTGMPGFGTDPSQPDLDSWKLVLFIRHLPKMTPDELEKMDDMDPKSPMELSQEEQNRRFLEGDDTTPPPAEHHHR